MTKPPQGQPTRIQLRTTLEKIQKLQIVVIVWLLITAALEIIESVNNIVQFRESVCRTNLSSPLCPQEKLDPQWIGTKIEDVYIKKLQNYEPETTLVVTDKPPDKTESKDISILRNVDQELAKINVVKKTNSGQYEAILRKAKNKGTPLCLQIYGKRKFATSEFKNIIDIEEEFPDSKTYDSRKPEEMDKKCKEKYDKIGPKNSTN
ncbi:MAG TPA: hypothetical protein DCY88_34340 [Cyanobacteria bacterium UBA11372]|nr:hypothetical protein [Cyanobacteria bacterium UBA11372]